VDRVTNNAPGREASQAVNGRISATTPVFGRGRCANPSVPAVAKRARHDSLAAGRA
jgi:hypothetical protein